MAEELVREHVQSHRREALHNDRYDCEFCWTSFKSESELREHQPRCDGKGYCLCHVERNIFYPEANHAKR